MSEKAWRKTPMIVCLCNALNEQKVKDAVGAGARSPHGVHRHHGTKVDCGQCLCAMAEIIDEHSGEKTPRQFATAAE